MNEPIEEIKEWIEKAYHDLGSAKIIYLHLPEYFDTIAFHCQQAVEKYIKAIEELESAIRISEEFRAFSDDLIRFK